MFQVPDPWKNVFKRGFTNSAITVTTQPPHHTIVPDDNNDNIEIVVSDEAATIAPTINSNEDSVFLPFIEEDENPATDIKTVDIVKDYSVKNSKQYKGRPSLFTDVTPHKIRQSISNLGSYKGKDSKYSVF